MPKQKSFAPNYHKKITALPEIANKAPSILSRPFVLGVLAFVIFFSLFGLLILQRYELVRNARTKVAYEIVNQAKEKIQKTLTHSLSATKTLTFFINKSGVVHGFDSVAKQILESNNDIDALQLVPGGVIQYMYPLKGNEEVIGYNILKDPARNREAYKSIERKEMFFAGPFELRQGGFGVVGRLPVYRNGKFWGFSAVIIKMNTLFKAAGIDSSEKNGYYFQLSKINPDTREEEYFLPRHADESKSQIVSVKVPDGEWKLSVISKKDTSAYSDIALLALSGLLLSIFTGVFICRVAARPQKLSELVKMRTAELKSSENNYRSLIERVSDAFVSLDKDWKYTYVNKKAGELFGRDSQSLVGKHIWTEFPEGIDQPFYHAYYRAMNTQTYQYVEEYYPPYDRWFENHIYPSADGLTIFFKDVTDIKAVSLALKKNEEKYRNLIEQASDGIVITDMEGNILEVNNSIIQMIGFTNDELIGHHITEYLPENDKDVIPLRINELMQGKSLLYERRLLKKDGTYLDVEINSKMASTHTLIGFIRDITVRKKNAGILKYQARLLEGVSDAIFSLDMERTIVSWNKACEELFGFKTEEVLGKRIPELVRFNYPNTNNEEVFKQVYQTGQWKGEFNFIHPQTKLQTDLLSSLSLLKNNNGNISGFIITSKDISERKKWEEALKKSNERFKLLASATNDVVWDHDFSTNITWGNKNLYKLYGMEEDAGIITYEMFMSRIHPDERTEIQGKLDNAVKKRQAFVTEEFRFKMANGEYRIFFDRAYIKYDDTGKPLRILGAMQDITEKEKAQKAIQESEEKFRLLIEQASDGIFVADENLYFIDVNTAACRMLGYTLEEIKKLRIPDLIPEEDNTTNPVKITDLKTGESIIKERRLLKKDGTAIDVEISAKLLPDGRYQSITRDITERKKEAEILQQSEQKYRLIFYNNPLPMWMTTLPGLDIIDVNDAAIAQYGYSREEFLKLNTRQLRPAEDIENFLREVDKMQPGIINLRNWRHKKKDGTVFFVETYSHEIMYEGQRAWLGLSHDVTEKYEARELLQKSHDDIRELASNLQSIREDERTNIAREIHDELGQQLTGLKMDLHWLSKKINSKDNDVNSKMSESIELINATIASVRKISTDLRPSILDDLGLVAALEWQGEEFEKRSGTRVQFINKAGDIKVKPEVTTAIFRIYQELLTNIARHANARLVRTLLRKEEGKLCFSITDNGTGFNLASIENKKTLGLLGIKERTLILGGTYEFKSKPGEGSETTIIIPLNNE